MLTYNNPFAALSLTSGSVEDATRTVAQAALINIATDIGLELTSGSFDAFTDQVNKVINDPNLRLLPGDLIRHAEAYANRGAQAIVANNGKRFTKAVWTSKPVCPQYPFCE